MEKFVGVDDLSFRSEEQHADHAHDNVGSHGKTALRQAIIVGETVRHEDPAREKYVQGLGADPLR